VASLAAGNAAAAVNALREAVRLQPSLIPARFNLGVALLVSGDLAGARIEFNAAMAAEPELRAQCLYHLGLVDERAGNPAAAAQWFEKAVAADPSMSDAILHLGVAREQLGDLQGAGRAYKQYLQFNPQSTVALLRFGVSAQRSGRIETARRYLEHVIQLVPQSVEAAEARKFLVMWD
jgi:Flp pilus assembly protein TadD